VSFISDLDPGYAVLLLNLLEGVSLALDEGDQFVPVRGQAAPHPLDHPLVEFLVRAPLARLRIRARVRFQRGVLGVLVVRPLIRQIGMSLKGALKRIVVTRVAVEAELEPCLEMHFREQKMNVHPDLSAVEDDQQRKFREGHPSGKKPDKRHHTVQGGLAPHLVIILFP
jgi:hypothetical protein